VVTDGQTTLNETQSAAASPGIDAVRLLTATTTKRLTACCGVWSGTYEPPKTERRGLDNEKARLALAVEAPNDDSQ
jgi:hypothetical protein